MAVVLGPVGPGGPARAGSALARAIPGAELTLLPRAGHFVARDAPEELAEAVRWTQRRSADRLVVTMPSGARRGEGEAGSQGVEGRGAA